MTGERNSGGDPTDPLVGRVAAILAGKTGNPDIDHPAWLAMSQAERESFYVKAEQAIDIIRRSDVYKASRAGKPPTGIVSKP